MHSICRAAAVLALSALFACSDGGAKLPPTTNPSNRPPIAQAGFDRAVGKQAVVTLDGTASVDPEGFPLTYLWMLASKPAGSTAQVQSPTSAVTQFTVDVPGAYVVRLQVSDGVNPAAVDEVTIARAAGASPSRSRGARATTLTRTPSPTCGPWSRAPSAAPLPCPVARPAPPA
jgi:hypothetical protein